MASYRKSLTLSLGLISLQVDLETVAPKVKSDLNRICPDHHVKLSQEYKCPGTSEDEKHVVTWGSWKMGKPTDDGYKVVNQEARPEVEKSKGMALTVVPKKGFEATTFYGESLYYATPSNEHMEQSWAILNKVVQSGKVALIARGALRKGTGTEYLWRLTSFNGYLVLRQVVFPENIKPSPELPKVKVNAKSYKLVQTLIDQLTTDWEKFDATDTMAARTAKWIDGGEDVEAQAAEVAPEMDMNAMLEAAIKG